MTMLKWNLEATISGMRVNDSFFIPCLKCSMDSRIRAIAKEFGYDVKIRNVTEEFVKGLRVWRVR
jgi:hypothetical protein